MLHSVTFWNSLFSNYLLWQDTLIAIGIVTSSLGARNRLVACELEFYNMWYTLNEYHHAFLNIKTYDDYLHTDITENVVNRQSCISFILKPREMGLINYFKPIGYASGHLCVSIHFNTNKSVRMASANMLFSGSHISVLWTNVQNLI